MSFISNFEVPPIPQDFLDKSQQQVVAEIFQKMKDLNLWENNWQGALTEDFSNQAVINSQLWECLVALYLNELDFSPKRFPQSSTNLDFGFSVVEKNYYGECVCVFDGDENENHGVQRFKDEDFQPIEGGIGLFAGRSGTVANTANRGGLRITGAIRSKNQQISKFFTKNDAHPTILFLATSELSDGGISISDCSEQRNMPVLSTVIAAVYGVDGVPSISIDRKSRRATECIVARSKFIDKSGKLVVRDGFLDESIENICGLFHFSGNLQNAVRAYLQGETISKIFDDRAEFIINQTCSENFQLRSIGQFPGVRVLWVNPEKTHVILQQNDMSCPIRMVENPA